MFRFHTGSIKSGKVVEASIQLGIMFRFHTGSIKSHIPIAFESLCTKLCFDSILVRLKVFPSNTTWRWSIDMFRFHTGSIKSRQYPKGRGGTIGFRFHTGSIKSATAVSADRACKCFDSILVRLKASGKRFSSRLVLRFRFHTGSIKSQRLSVDSVASEGFRFHTGSIKSAGALF